MAYVTSWERIAKKEGRKEGKMEGIKVGKTEGIKVGKMEGIKEGKLDTARRLLKKGVDMDIIVEATGFPKKELEKLTATTH